MDPLELLRIREEVLQAMYWMRAEGIDSEPSVEQLSRFLAVPAPTLAPYIESFVSDGHLAVANGGYSLTPTGEEAGKRGFADEFADVTKPGHGECDADCWCNSSPEAAADCIEGRAHAHH